MKTKFLLFSLMLSLLSITNVWAEDASYALGWGDATGTAGTFTNFTATSGNVSGIVSFSTAKNSSATAPAYNSNNKDLRLYYHASGAGGSITLTPATGVTITGFVMKTSTTPSVKYSVDGGTAQSTSASNNMYTVTDISATSSLEIQNVNTSNTQLRIKWILISYSTGGTPTPTLTGVTISGDLSTKTYETTDYINVTGLTVTGSYSEGDPQPITSGITWKVRTNSQGEAVAPEAYQLTAGQTSLQVQATVSEIASEWLTITGLTVTAPEGDIIAIGDITFAGSSSYCNWNTVDKTSASYIGNSNYTQSYIQLRNQSSAGIVSTTSGGNIKKVKVKWAGNNTNNRYLTVYGSNTAYIATSDLYDDTKRGTELGTLTFTTGATSAEFTYDGSEGAFEYVGIKASGAIYFTPITFVWEPGKQLSSIAVETNPTKTSYMIGETFDAAGLVITATYDDSSTEDVAYAGNEGKFSFSGFNSASAAASQEITVTYGGKTTTFNVEILDVTLQSVTVSGTPTTLSYTAGDTFDPAGLIVTGHYSDNTDAEITSGITWSYPDANSLLAYEQTSIRVVATVDEVASVAYTVSDLIVAAAPLVASWVASEQGYSDQTDMTEQTIAFGPSSNFSLVFAKGTNSNAPKYYNTGTAVRAYGGNTFALSSTDYKFTKIVITFGSSDGSNEITANVGTYDAGSWTGNSKEVTFAIGGTSGNRRIASVTVTYEEALPSAATPTFSVEAGTYFEAQNVTITTTTEGATIYYTTDGTEPTTESSVYTDPIAVSTDMTIKALAAKNGMDNSAVASATYIMGPIFTSLEGLVAADLSSNTMVKVSFSNVAIKTIDSNKKYVTFDIQKEDKDIEIYYNAETLPTNWVVNGTLSGTILAPWKRYPATGTLNCWELAPEAGWAWTELAYSSPIVKTIDHVTVSGTATKTAYIDGEVFDPAGLVVTLYYTDETNEVVTDGILWAPTTALTMGMTSVDVTATVENVTSATYPVTVSVSEIPTKTITEFITNQGGRCYLVGVVSNFANSNKNATLTDNSGSILLYNISKNGEVTDFVTLEVEEGDRIKVIATTYQLYYEKDEVVAPEFVEKLAPEVVHVTGVTVAPTEASVKVGKTVALTATIAPALATDKAVSWSSNAEGVATVDENGVVTGVAEGTANITVTTHDGDFEAICTVTVAKGSDFANGDWMLVTDANELTAGSYVIIAAAEYDKAMKPYVSGNNCKSNDATKSGSMITYDSELGIFAVQTGTKENTIALFDEDNSYYLYAASGSSNYLKGETELDDNGSWTVSVADGVATLTAQGTNTRNIIKYNAADDQKIFSCYASTSTNMKAIALYKYYAPVPKVLYDKNTEEDVTNLPGTTRAELEDNVYKATISTTTPHRSGYQFTGWKDADNNDYIAGSKYTITDDITLYAQWDVLAGHHITYVTVGTAPTDENTYYAGDAVTLASADGLSNPGYVFDGWNDGSRTYPAGDDKYEMPDNDVTFTAVWARATNDKWVLVTDVTNLKTDGTKYLIASAEEMTDGKYYAMAEQKSNNRAAVEVMHSEGVIRGSSVLAAFVLEDAENGMFAIKTSDGYLYTAANNNNYLRTQTENNVNGKWTITIEDGVASIVATNSSNRNVMQFNYASNNQIFSCYSSASQKPLAIYEKAPNRVIEDETVNASDLTAGTDVTIKDGGTLTVDGDKQIGDLTVEEGGVVALNNTLTVVGTFTIETTMAGGKSGQLKGANTNNFIAQADAYIDITLGDNGNADKWHAFTVPFPVDALNGIFDLNGNKLVNETNYAIMDYHGDIRAQGKYGWKKFRGTLVPGTFYLMTVDGLRTTYRMKMKAGSNVVADNIKDFYKYAASGEGQATDAGWNGIGNPTLAYGQVNVAVQVLDPVHYVYETKNANSCNFIVGTPFFYQAAADGSISMIEANASAYYAPIRKAVKTTEQIKVSLANENYTDNLFISASEDATNNYQVGKDLVKMTMTNTPIVPQIFGVAYKTQLSMVHAPLVGDRANYTLNLYAPADGEYTISAQQTEDAIVYLTYEGSPIWNITAGEYNCDLQKGNNSGFGLMLVRRAPQVTTDIEGANQSQNGVRKLLINGQLFIEKEGKLFNVTGERL